LPDASGNRVASTTTVFPVIVAGGGPIGALPGTPKHVNILGYFYDIDQGTLTEVVADKS
jgi:hypothetical protein